MKALVAWLLVRAATAEWWSFVNDNTLRVTDELIVGAVLSKEPGGLEWNDGWPAEGKALCFRLGSREACRTDWGALGAPAVSPSCSFRHLFVPMLKAHAFDCHAGWRIAWL